MKRNQSLFIVVFIFITVKAIGQNVGIGVNNPQQKLHVAGNIRIDSLAGSGNGIIATNANGDLSKINLTGDATDVLLGNGSFGAVASTSLPSGAIVGSAISNNQNLLSAGFSLHGELNTQISTYVTYPSLVSEQYMDIPTYETGDPNKSDAPVARANNSDIWTGSELIVWGGYNINTKINFLDDGARYNPVTDTWIPMSPVNAPSKRIGFAYAWSGTEAFFWGGADSLSASGYQLLNTGKRYNPVTDTWANMTTVAAPSSRQNAASVWTGANFIVWGGSDNSGPLTTGARYSPSTSSWSSMSTLNAPPSSGYADRMFWTGSQVIVLGNIDSVRRYNPVTNLWSISAKCPAGPSYNKKSAVWTGTELWVYNDQKIYKYNPATNIWTTVNVLGAYDLYGPNILNAVWGDNVLYVLVRAKDTDGRFIGNKYYNYSPSDNTFHLNGLYNNEGTNQETSFVKAGSMLIKWGGSLQQETYDGTFYRFSRRGVRIYLTSGMSIPPFYYRTFNDNKLYLYRKD